MGALRPSLIPGGRLCPGLPEVCAREVWTPRGGGHGPPRGDAAPHGSHRCPQPAGSGDLAARCRGVNGTVADWQSRLQSAIPVLEQLAQGAQHPEPLRRSCLRQSRFPWTRSGRCSARWPVSCARWCKPPTRFVDSPSPPQARPPSRARLMCSLMDGSSPAPRFS